MCVHANKKWLLCWQQNRDKRRDKLKYIRTHSSGRNGTENATRKCVTMSSGCSSSSSSLLELKQNSTLLWYLKLNSVCAVWSDRNGCRWPQSDYPSFIIHPLWCRNTDWPSSNRKTISKESFVRLWSFGNRITLKAHKSKAAATHSTVVVALRRATVDNWFEEKINQKMYGKEMTTTASDSSSARHHHHTWMKKEMKKEFRCSLK